MLKALHLVAVLSAAQGAVSQLFPVNPSISFVLLKGRAPQPNACRTGMLSGNPDWESSVMPAHLQCFNLDEVFYGPKDNFTRYGTPTPISGTAYNMSIDDFDRKRAYTSIQYIHDDIAAGDEPGRALIFYGGANCTEGAVRFSCAMGRNFTQSVGKDGKTLTGSDKSRGYGYCADLPLPNGIKSFALAPVPKGEECVLGAFEKGAYEVRPDGTVVGNVTSESKASESSSSRMASSTVVPSSSTSTEAGGVGNTAPASPTNSQSPGKGAASSLSVGVGMAVVVSFMSGVYIYF